MAQSVGKYDLSQVLSGLRIDERGWTVLQGRSGLTTKQTLESIGRSLDVTRERIRQIEEKALLRLRNGTLILADVGRVLEDNCQELGKPFAPNISRSSLLRRLEKLLVRCGFAHSEVTTRYRLIVAFRGGEESYRNEWPRVCLLLCSLEPPIVSNPGVRIELNRRQDALFRRQEARRPWPYAKLVSCVLEEEGVPMHWHDIADRAERLGKRKSFSTSSLFNVLLYQKHRFVRVGSGTYGLSKWGITERLSNVDLVAAYLQDRKRTASFGEINHHVGIPTGIKENSLKMSLDLNPRFYRSIDNEYGLRAWLPPKERQTLRASRSKIEASDSVLRVERARARGYDIDSIVAKDKEIVL